MRNILWVFGIVAVFTSCEIAPDGRKLVDDFVVSTNFDTQADFSEYITYAIPTDTIGYLSNTDPDDTLLVQGNDLDFPRPVLNAIRNNLNRRGYTEVDKDENPDLGVNVTLVNDFNVFQQVIYPNSYYSGYYGYGSWYSYPYVNTYAYNTGVLIVELVDLKNRNSQNQVRVIWSAYMGDVYSSADPVSDAREAIDQSFIQSSYLQK